MKLKEWFDFFFRDKRFGWRFKLADFIMNDYLRNYLAVGVNLSLDNAKNYCEIDKEFCKEKIDQAIDTVNELFEM